MSNGAFANKTNPQAFEHEMCGLLEFGTDYFRVYSIEWAERTVYFWLYIFCLLLLFFNFAALDRARIAQFLNLSTFEE